MQITLFSWFMASLLPLCWLNYILSIVSLYSTSYLYIYLPIAAFALANHKLVLISICHYSILMHLTYFTKNLSYQTTLTV